MNPRKMIGPKAWSSASHYKKVRAKRLAQKYMFVQRMSYDMEAHSTKPMYRMGL